MSKNPFSVRYRRLASVEDHVQGTFLDQETEWVTYEAIKAELVRIKRTYLVSVLHAPPEWCDSVILFVKGWGLTPSALQAGLRGTFVRLTIKRTESGSFRFKWKRVPNIPIEHHPYRQFGGRYEPVPYYHPSLNEVHRRLSYATEEEAVAPLRKLKEQYPQSVFFADGCVIAKVQAKTCERQGVSEFQVCPNEDGSWRINLYVRRFSRPTWHEQLASFSPEPRDAKTSRSARHSRFFGLR